MKISTETVAGVLPMCTRAVQANWPLIAAALERQGIDTPECEIAAIATVAVETAHTFEPIHELGGPQYFSKYDGRADLGNTRLGDGYRYRGRGFVQITGRLNYVLMGARLGVDLAGDPELACEPGVAASLLAMYFADRRIAKLANALDWEHVRRAVNGGLNGWDDFLAHVSKLSTAAGLPVPVIITA